MTGHPDDQGYPLWIGDPLVQNAALAIGAGSNTDGPFNVANFASVILAVKPTGGKITATITETINTGAASLIKTSTFTILSGVVNFNTVVLTGNVVTLKLQGDTGGETVAYALYPSNTTVSSSVVSAATVNFYKNDGAVFAAEAGLNFSDNAWNLWTLTDTAGTSVNVSAKPAAGVSGTNSSVTVTATTEATATTIVTASAYVLDGATPVLVEFFAPHCQWTPSVGGDQANLALYDGASSIGLICRISYTAGLGQSGVPLSGRAILDGANIPSNATHTYSVRGFKSVAGDTFIVDGAGAGAGFWFPILLTVVPTTI